MARLEGSRALVTGATGGLGHAIARALRERGASLVLTGRRREALESLSGELDAEVFPADLASAEDVRALADGAGRIDVLVANAGLPGTGTLDSFTPEEVDRVLDVNLRAPVHLARALTPAMVERGEGHLVFVSSMSGKVPSPYASLYCATKFGLRGFAASLREDLRDTGVGVTTIFPGPVSGAGMWADAALENPRGLRTSSPVDVAEAVITGIERDRGEIDVAAALVRFGGRLAGVAPSTAVGLQRRLGGTKVAADLSEAQRAKR
jgi:short-subunit dehydrogenase